MKILIIDDSDTTRQVIISCLEQALSQVEIIEVTSSRLACALYSSDPFFELVIGSLDLQTDSFLNFYQHLQKQDATIPILTYSQGEGEAQLPNSSHLLLDGNNIRKFRQQLIANLPIDDSLKAPLPVEDQQGFQKVRLFYFWRFHKTQFPIYLKLGADKFVKILNANQEYGPDFIAKYEGKHQNYLYLRSEDFAPFLELIFKKPLYEEDPTVTPEERLMRSHHFIYSMAISSGLTPNLIEVAKKTIENVESFSKTTKSLSKMIHILKARGGYNSDHALLLSYLTSAMCDRLDWSARRSKEKLAMASLFHDINLTDQKLAALSYLDNLQEQGLNKENTQKYLEHPIKCAELVLEALSQYPQLDQIIANHHERPDGSGFPYGRDYNQIGPLPSLFIVAHDYVSRLFKCHFDLSHSSEILNEMGEQYRLGHFLKCLGALEEIIVEEQKVTNAN